MKREYMVTAAIESKRWEKSEFKRVRDHAGRALPHLEGVRKVLERGTEIRYGREFPLKEARRKRLAEEARRIEASIGHRIDVINFNVTPRSVRRRVR